MLKVLLKINIERLDSILNYFIKKITSRRAKRRSVVICVSKQSPSSICFVTKQPSRVVVASC